MDLIKHIYFLQYKYKATYEKQKGHYIGTPTAKDDPKLMWLIKSGKLPSDLIYKKDYEKTKTRVHLPADAVSILTAKQVQAAASEIDYRHYLHEWTCHPDQNDCIQARKAYDLQSDVSIQITANTLNIPKTYWS